jgi:hypothetical protein
VETKTSIGFPTNTVVLIIATMIASGAASWFIVSQGLKRLLVTQHLRYLSTLSAAILLSTWLLVQLVLAVNPPGDAVLATQFLITFTLLGLGLIGAFCPC